MADLIIKPSTGGSNTLILQDEGGDAALTIGATGNTTLAGTANNLGTTTAGTLSSGVTFPTGHVLQTLYDVDATAQVVATDTYTATDLSIAITPSVTSSKILCIWTMMADIGYGEGYGTQLMRDSTIIYETGTGYNVYNGGSGNSRPHSTYIHLDSPSTTSAATYLVKVCSYSSNSITVNDASNQSHLLIMEIAG